MAVTKSHHPSVQLTLFTIGEHSVAVEKDAQELHQEEAKKFADARNIALEDIDGKRKSFSLQNVGGQP